jgi:hypothetical protein
MASRPEEPLQSDAELPVISTMHTGSPDFEPIDDEATEGTPDSAPGSDPEGKTARSSTRMRVKSSDEEPSSAQVAKPPSPRQSAAAAKRRESLEKMAGTLGVDWARAYRDELRGQGRAAAGAWPGTISEARARVEFRLSLEASRRGWSGIADAERAELSRVVYAAAKNFWNEHRDRDDEDDD